MCSSLKKKLIIDKSVFVEEINRDNLCKFAAGHFLILPMNLYSECATNKKNWQKQFEKFRNIIISGGHICSTLEDIIKQEGQLLRPFDFQEDVDKETYKMREEFQKGGRFAEPDIDDIRKSHDESAQTLIKHCKKVTDLIDNISGAKFSTAAEEVRKSQAGRDRRFVIWAKTVDSLDIHELAVRGLSKFSESPDKYCLSSEWVTWHYLRGSIILAFEYTFLGGKPGKNQLTIAEHDLHDEEYGLLLSRVDGLLTRDEKFVKPLAKATFPEKDVFSCLDEVTEDYRC
jgi:hypothetical protein